MNDAIDVGRSSDPAFLGFQQRWEAFDALCGEKIRTRDAAWAAGLSPAARLAVVDDLFTSIRAVRVAAGDWQDVDERAWRETLAERTLQVKAYRCLDEMPDGTSPPADAG